MRFAIAFFLMLCACGRTSEPGDWTGATTVGCADFFVAFVSADKTRALTVQVDRKGSGIGVGTTTVAPQNVTLKLDSFGGPMTGAYYCTDLASGARPSSTPVKAGSVTVTIPANQMTSSGSYPLTLELKDIDFGGGVVVPSLTATNVNVGWFPG